MKVTRLLCELSKSKDDSDAPTPLAAGVLVNPWKPWLKDFNHYLNTFDQLAENQTIVQWTMVGCKCLFSL